MSKQNSIFRKVSLDRLASPEQLDQKLTVISPVGWVACVSLAILIIATSLWGFLGSVSDKVNGGGILMYGEGVGTFTAQTDGQITDVSVYAGDFVESGQVIARVSQHELIQQIERCRENIDALKGVDIETLEFNIGSLNSEIYSEFAQLAGQIRAARVQFDAQKNEAEKNEKDISNQREQQAQQVTALERQIKVLEDQIKEHEEHLSYQRKIELENAEKQSGQPQANGDFYTSDRGDYYRRNYSAAHQFTVTNQLGAAYVILSDKRNSSTFPVFYMDSSGEEVYNKNGKYYLPNYYESLLGNTYSGLPSKSARKTVYIDTMTGARYIDMSGKEFKAVSDEELSGIYQQVKNRPAYDPSLASMQSQLENNRMQLIQAKTQSSQLNSTFTKFLWGGYNQTGEQISSLMGQFSHLKQIKERELLRNLQELQLQLSLNSVIKAQYSGTIASLNIQSLDYVQPGSVLGTITRDGQASSVLMYVPITDGKRITAGMEVNISPTTVNREEYGYMVGRVKSVSTYAVTQEHMMLVLQNQQLVQAFSEQTAVMEVEVELLRDPETESGYKWSTPKGAPFGVDSGTICMSEIKVASKRPVDMIVPFVKRLLGS
ncbi:MAG: NHLP bacteriocin system secretion protein [Oscillospiraceae bacterium]|nr:NHLP bacteriocin system secretion protein [Oscillospiraceae bacterium]